MTAGATTFVVAIPLGQGQVFNEQRQQMEMLTVVAIPLGQGQVFNAAKKPAKEEKPGRNPFGSGTGF